MLKARHAMAIAVLILFAADCSAQTKPVHSPAPLTEEQLNVYQAFLDKLGPTLHIRNLANATTPFDFVGFPEGRPCLSGIELENLSEPLGAVHAFGPEIAKGRELNLVETHEQLKLFRKRDGASENQPGQATQDKNALNFVIFSEIAFDKKHQFAVLKWILVSGDHSDAGATLVMEKVDGRWTLKPRGACAMFVNNSWGEMPR
jgi:hypothetical protein